jgi:hydrogenase expression/formation protein HypE
MKEGSEIVGMQGAVCPLPLHHSEKIIIGHGSGGKMMLDLIKRAFLPPLSNPVLLAGNDAGVVQPTSDLVLAISTDSHVVWPLFFPGGDIGSLAICGTVNDVAMMGATPLYLTAGFILEEGLTMDILERVVASMANSAEEAGVQIIAGDTKVVEKGKADGMYISTSGVGIIESGLSIEGSNAQPGDKVIISGPIGDHGIAVLSERGELGFEADVKSDIAPLNHLVKDMLRASDKIHVLRDPTRGGVATSLNEIASQSQVGIVLDEVCIPVRPAVQSACELLGFDPLYVANEGKLIAIVGSEDTQVVLKAMHENEYGRHAKTIGEVTSKPKGRVLMKTLIGTHRVVDVLMGEMLPRIC